MRVIGSAPRRSSSRVAIPVPGPILEDGRAPAEAAAVGKDS